MSEAYNPLDGERGDIGIHIARPPIDDMVSIIVVNHDRPEFLNVCLQSIAINSSNNNYEIIVADSGSIKSDTIQYLSALEDQGCKVVKKRDNVYWSEAANAGAKLADKKSRYLIFMHEDTVVLNPTWIDMLVNISDAEKSGIVGLSRHNYEIDKQRFEFIEEWCVLITRDCWEDCGPFEEQLPILGAPFLFTYAAHQADYKPQYTGMPLVHHYASFSIGVSEFEQAGYEARERLPKLMHQIGQRSAARSAKRIK